MRGVVTHYVSTMATGAKSVLCVAAYPKSHPELEKDVINAFKGLRNSKAK